MSLMLLYFISMIIKYKKCKSWREFNKILRKYAKRYYKTRRQFGRCTLDCPWWIWVEYDIDTYTELQSLYKYYSSHKHRFWTNLNEFIKKAIDNYGKEGKYGKLIGLNVTNEDYYYIYSKDGKIVYDTCVSGLA